jgi:AbrB family looped-hinge helix DNA binding protein
VKRFRSISANGQITLPAEFRKQIGYKSREQLIVELSDDVITIRRIKDLLDMAGILGKRKSDKCEEDGIMEGAVERSGIRKKNDIDQTRI